MPFLGVDFPEPVAPLILAFCSAIPCQNDNGIAAVSQDCHAYWRRALITKARSAFLQFLEYHDRLLDHYEILRNSDVGVEGPMPHTPLEDEAMHTLGALADMLCLTLPAGMQRPTNAPFYNRRLG